MHDIEPYFKWRENYVSSEDSKSPFYGRTYSEFSFSQKIYNYFIHPQWDEIGSPTLYIKILFVDYEEGYAIIEMMGEWNDCINNDIMFLKREIADHLGQNGITKFILLCENVLNFHGSDDCYYEEWFEDVTPEFGWVCLVNILDHVYNELDKFGIQYYVQYGEEFNEINWHLKKPESLYKEVILKKENRQKGVSN